MEFPEKSWGKFWQAIRQNNAWLLSQNLRAVSLVSSSTIFNSISWCQTFIERTHQASMTATFMCRSYKNLVKAGILFLLHYTNLIVVLENTKKKSQDNKNIIWQCNIPTAVSKSLNFHKLTNVFSKTKRLMLSSCDFPLSSSRDNPTHVQLPNLIIMRVVKCCVLPVSHFASRSIHALLV